MRVLSVASLLQELSSCSEELTGELTFLDGPPNYFEFVHNHNPSPPIISLQGGEGRTWFDDDAFEFDVRSNAVDSEQYAPIRSEDQNLSGYQALPSSVGGHHPQPLYNRSDFSVAFPEQQYNDDNPEHFHLNYFSKQTTLDAIGLPGLLSGTLYAVGWV